MTNQHSCQNHFLYLDASIQKNISKVKTVLWITTLTMIFEIYYGYTTGSMSLLADGWHMTTHVAALAITFITYKIATNTKMVKQFNFGGGKIIALGGFTSSVFLLFVVFLIGREAITRLISPEKINYNEALWVATIGFLVNLICAFILRDSHTHSAHGHSHSHAEDHKHGHGEQHSDDHIHSPGHTHSHDHTHGHGHDHNIRGAYLHVLADALTSVGAIVALLAAKYYGLTFLDPIVGLVGALVILKWAHQLIKDTGWELLDGHAQQIDFQKLKNQIEKTGARILDLHVWAVAPRMLACELVVTADKPQGVEFYRHILHEHFAIQHSVIEERKS